MRLDYRCNLPLLFPVLDSPPHQLPAVRRSIYPFCFPLYERYFFVKGNHTARPVECMPCTPAHASIDRIFFRHIANAANALVSPHYLFFDISNSYVGIGILLRPCIDPQLCILHSQQ